MANTKLILLEDVEELGQAGDRISVAPGYARNYLMPRGLAVVENPGALRQLEARRERIEAKRQKELEANQSLAEKLAAAEVTIPMQAGDDDQLFGSVGAHMIADELAKQGMEIEHRRIQLDENIKGLGVYQVEIKLPQDISTNIKVWVVRA